jgi:hypothetical protein
VVANDHQSRVTLTASSPFLIAGPLVIAAAVALVTMAVSAVSVDDQIRWGSTALAAFCGGLLLLTSQAARLDGLGLSSWRIGPWSLVWGGLAFGLATISWLGQESGPAAEIWPASVLRALWMIGTGLAMLTVGYCAGPYRLAANRARRVTDALGRRFTTEIRGPAVPWTLLGVGTAAQLGFALVNGRFGYVGNAAASVTTASGYGQYLAVAGECTTLAVMAAAMRANQIKTLWAWVSLGLVFAADIAEGAVAGGKESFVVAIIAVIIPYSIVRRRVPVRILAAAALVFLLVIIPFNQAYRASARGAVTLTTSQAIATAPAIADQVIAKDFSLTVLGTSASYLAQRVRTIDSPAIIMQRTPSEIPYASPGQLLIAPIAALIPRILWPGKPILTPGYQISQDYYQLPAQVYTSSNVTPEADLYRHGGWVPLILGMFLLGCLLRIIDEMTDLRRSAHGAFLLILLFPDIVQAGSDCTTLLAEIPGMVLLWLAVIAASFRRRQAPG